jgi:hypothetical protein
MSPLFLHPAQTLAQKKLPLSFDNTSVRFRLSTLVVTLTL